MRFGHFATFLVERVLRRDQVVLSLGSASLSINGSTEATGAMRALGRVDHLMSVVAAALSPRTLPCTTKRRFSCSAEVKRIRS
jgi:hypothetical protein